MREFISASSPLSIALTGGIGSGKTAVSDRFAQLGVPVIDTDQISRGLVQPGSEILKQITDHFGSAFLTKNGELNRQKLRRQIFSNPSERKALEAIMHPAIREKMLGDARNQDYPYVILVIPLLVESGLTNDFNRILLVDVPETAQIERVVRRDGVSREEVQKILNSQASRTDRLALADDVINNTGTLTELNTGVLSLHNKYLQQSDYRSANHR